MARKILINAVHPEEIRVAIVEDGILEELNIQSAARAQLKGNIYKAAVVRLEPSLQAAFVEYGGGRHGFLPFDEIRPACYAVQAEKKTDVRIQDVLVKGYELLVQIEKEERDQKGAYLTTYVSFPGRYLVLMPDNPGGHISRKIVDETERKDLRTILEELHPPEGMGYIIRTAGLGHTKTELAKDLQALLRLWEGITQKGSEVKAPALIYEEHDVVVRTLRDYFTTDTDEILVDSREAHARALEFFKTVMPRYRNRVKLSQEKRPIFSKYNLEEQIEHIYERKVQLKSGGSIVIDTTEALVAVDVNSGKAVGEKGIEETAFKTNMEAAEEIARQLRLRDLGGLVVVDFIDMASRKHNREVEKHFKTTLRKDKARIDLSRISRFGMLELSRQRLGPPVREGAYVTCFHCGGSGLIRSTESLALIILRKIQANVAKGSVAEVRGIVATELAGYLLNQKRDEISRLEQEHRVQISLLGDPQLFSSQYSLEFIKREAEAQGPEPETPAPEEAPEKPPKRRRRKRRKRRKVSEADVPAMGQENGSPEFPGGEQTVSEPSAIPHEVKG